MNDTPHPNAKYATDFNKVKVQRPKQKRKSIDDLDGLDGKFIYRIDASWLKRCLSRTSGEAPLVAGLGLWFVKGLCTPKGNNFFPFNASRFARQFGVEGNHITKGVGKLEESGLIERRDKKQGRKSSVRFILDDVDLNSEPNEGTCSPGNKFFENQVAENDQTLPSGVGVSE
jgi:hypothetical protein